MVLIYNRPDLQIYRWIGIARVTIQRSGRQVRDYNITPASNARLDRATFVHRLLNGRAEV